MIAGFSIRNGGGGGFFNNPKPFSKSQMAYLINNLIKINPYIRLDERLLELAAHIKQ